jgi:hypothetical protein
MERADFANVNFRETGTAAYIWEDFLSDSGGKDRVARGIDMAKERLTVMRANQALSGIVAGKPPTEDVPAWAIGAYHAN